MNKHIATALAATAILAAPAWAQETPPAGAQSAEQPTPAQAAPQAAAQPTAQSVGGDQSLKQLAELGAGVHKVKKDPDGKFKSCVVVGEARISTVLGASKGLQVARRNARLSAEGAFVAWMKSKVARVAGSGNKTEIFLKGDDEGMSESGESTETNTEITGSVAEGLISGLSLIGQYRDGEEKMLYMVYGWTPSHAEVAAQAAVANNAAAAQADASAPPSANAPAGTPPTATRATTTRKTEIETRVLVSEEAAEFF